MASRKGKFVECRPTETGFVGLFSCKYWCRNRFLLPMREEKCYKVDPVVGPWNPVRRTGDLRTYFRASVAAGTNAFAQGGGRMPATCKAIVLLPLLPGRADLAACD